jgi:hypothetical protein
LVGPLWAGAFVAASALSILVLSRTMGGVPVRSASPSVPEPTHEPMFTFKSLVLVLVLAVVFRVGVALVVNSTSLWLDFAPDAYFYRVSGQAIAESWHSPVANLQKWFGEKTDFPFYSYLNAFCAYALGAPQYWLSIFNGLFGILVAWNFARVAETLYGKRAAKYTFLLAVFFPSLVLWSSMNIRDVWSWFFISIVLLSAQRLRMKFSPLQALVLIGALATLSSIRVYLVPLLLVAIGLSFVVVRLRQLPYAIIGLFTVGTFLRFAGPELGLYFDLFSDRGLETVHQMRVNLAFGGSAYGSDVDTRTLSSTLLYLPEGIIRFLMVPFPWSISSWRQLLTLPESLVWYYLLFRAIRCLIREMREDLPRIATLFFVLVVLTSAYGLASGNEGTAYRHRAQVVALFFIFAVRDHLKPQRRAASEPSREELSDLSPAGSTV